MRRLALVAAWVMATAVVTFGAWQFVDAASSQVSDQPLIPLAAPDSTPATAPTTSLATTTSVPVTVAGTGPTSTEGTVGTTTTRPATTSTTRATTTTTRQGATTSTTAGTTEAWKQQSVPSPGGTVRVSYRGDEVRFETAQPAPGFQTDVEKAGPDEVRVEFDGDGVDYEVKARSVRGVLQASVTETGGGDDD